MKYNLFKITGAAFILIIAATACTKLNVQTYSVIPVSDYWQTQAQIIAGEAPAYQQLQNVVDMNGNVMEMIEPCTDELFVPTRGNDWGDAGHWNALFYHNWTANNNNWDNGWQAIFTGVSKCNLIINSVKALNPQPSGVDTIFAALKTLRAYYYYMAMDMFGNVPILTDTTTVSNIPNSPRATVYNWIISELQTNLPYLPSNVDATTYGLVTKYFSYALLARLYLNQQVFAGNYSSLPVTPGAAAWQQCINYCDSVLAGPYSLTTGYFDNFSSTNDYTNTENIFCVPFDAINIPNNSVHMTTLHYNNNINFAMTTSPWNGFCATADFYYNYDTSSTYKTSQGNTYRTFNDQRTGQWLIGQQYSPAYPYPPNANVLVNSTNTSLAIVDNHTTDTLLTFTASVPVFSNPSAGFHGAGVRNVKYFPAAGSGQNLSNDVVVFRLADVMLMKAEALLRLNNDVADAQPLLDAIRARAYGANTAPALTATLNNIYWERGRELAWEGVRREDMIRYEVASGMTVPYFSQAYGSDGKVPAKPQDVMDGHLYIFPIPSLELTANGALKQNQGYQ